MKSAIVIGVAIAAGILAIISYTPLSAHFNNGSLLEECKNLGIPEFTCTKDAVLAKKGLIENSATIIPKATRSQLDECKNLGIAEFMCSQDEIDAKKLLSSGATYTQGDKELLEVCKEFGIAEFQCTEKAILEKKT